ncbi:MAG TPA: FKBP-type peptidyl-prolyl cis-trans isomerase [Steroidobacteraceae bacterium]|nr:FKBP-type peptidyl-prolyl cis-trans isomerase [Steroidobacteraceae bacterium]
MNVAVHQRRTLRAVLSRQGWICAVLAGALFAGVAQTQAQDTGSAKPQAPAPAAKKPAAHAKAAAGAKDEKSSASYSIGLSMGTSLRQTGLSSETVSVEKIAQGIRDSLSGKVKLTPQDQQNVQAAVIAARTGMLDKNHRAAAAFLADNAKKQDVVTTKSGLQYKVVAPGNGTPPAATDEVSVNYKGSLLDGTVFDTSERNGGPVTFPVNRVIPGWTEALQLMKPGAKYQLFIPPNLAYDERSPSPEIPPGAMLVFDVELVSVKHPTPAAAPHAPAPAPSK